MFSSKFITGGSRGVSATGPRKIHGMVSSTASQMPSITHEVKANLGFGGGSQVPVSTVGAWASEYQYMMTGLIPADPMITDSSGLSLFYRDIYLMDATAGSAVDIQSTFPFSDFKLRGLPSKKLRPFEEALERLNIRRMMPEISTAYLVDGFFCGTLVFDPRTKKFVDTMIHDALQCSIRHNPFYNMDPEIQVRVGSEVQQFLHSGSEYAKRYLRTLPPTFVNLLRKGMFTLDPLGTLFVPRRSLTDRAYSSYLHRILPMYLIEKTMFRGTLTEAHRRQRAMTHITAGDDNWTPNTKELQMLIQQFQTAEFDPLGGWVSTRASVQATDIRPGGDFWKWTDMADVMVPMKLRALGISESFLSGDASYAAAESAYGVFLESQDAYRGFLTTRVFDTKIFPLVAVVNGLYKPGMEPKGNRDALQYLTDASSRYNLEIPELHWDKQLESDHEDGMFELLEKLDERGIPLPIKAWTAAAGMDMDSLVADLKEDGEIRKTLEEYTGKDTSHDQDGDYGIESSYDIDGAPKRMGARIGSLGFSDRITTHTVSSGLRRRRNLLEREYGPEYDGLVSASNRSGSGRKHIYNQKAARSAYNDMLIESHRRLQDPNERQRVKNENIRRFGSATIPGASDLPVRQDPGTDFNGGPTGGRARRRRKFF